MKRSLLSALIIGLIVGGIVMGLHVSGFLLRPELAITDILSRDGSANRLISDKAQYVIVFLLAIGVAWMTLASSRRGRMSAIVGILLLELIGAAWIFSLYHIFFQPLPALGGAVLERDGDGKGSRSRQGGRIGGPAHRGVATPARRRRSAGPTSA